MSFFLGCSGTLFYSSIVVEKDIKFKNTRKPVVYFSGRLSGKSISDVYFLKNDAPLLL